MADKKWFILMAAVMVCLAFAGAVLVGTGCKQTISPRPVEPEDETGYDLWLRYKSVSDTALLDQYRQGLTEIVVQGNSDTLNAIRSELNRGLDGLLEQDIPASSSVTQNGAVVAGTSGSSALIASLGYDSRLSTAGPEGFIIKSANIDGKNVTVIASQGQYGVLYGVFAFLRLIQTNQSLAALDILEKPKIQLRMLNHWDNIGDSTERGYAGLPLWKWNELPARVDPRYTDYARANASIGINGTVLNNVNASSTSLTTAYLEKTAAIADALRPYGVKVYLTAKFSAPRDIGGLGTADPLNANVINWWNAKADEIYKIIPDFGGFLVKAYSEGQPGPQDYGRTHTDGANMMANALLPHDGVVMWRAFVYNNEIDRDRVKQSYKEFQPLDGRFNANVFVQTKNGALDFQPREPFHPLFGGVPNTQLMMEFQITQEYVGHSTHLVYLGDMWKEILDSDTYANGAGSTVAKVIDGSVHGYAMTGIAGVANAGDDTNWCGHHFAAANWYAFGRLSWDHSLTSAGIANEWAKMTWGNDPTVVNTVTSMMLGSWETCVDYTTPIGLAFMCERGPHYDPDPYHRETYHHCNKNSAGYDRTTSGTNAVSQYHNAVRDKFNSTDTCPDDYLLWFHSVGYDHRMHSGRTVIQELYHRYYQGVYDLNDMISGWSALSDKIDSARFNAVKNKLSEQKIHAEQWRDECTEFFHELSSVPIPPFVPD